MKLLYGALLCIACGVQASPVTEDKYWGFEEFPVKSLGMCRVTEFPALEFHFRCRSRDDFNTAHDMLIKNLSLEFNGYTRDFRDLPEYISFWVKLKDPKSNHGWKCGTSN